MRLEHEFTVPVPVDEAWPILLDIERIAPCMPGAKIDTVDGDDFTGTVKVKLGPINLTYKGAAKFTSKDDATHTAIIDARGRDSRGNGTANALITANLEDSGTSTVVKVATDLNITGKPAQFGRGVMVDVGNKLIGQFADCLAGKLGQSDADYATEQQDAAAAAGEPAGATGSGDSTDADSDAQKGAQDAGAVPAADVTESAPAPEAEVTPKATPHARPPAAAAHSAHGDTPRPARVQAEPEPIDLLELAGGSVAKRVVPVVGVIALLTLLFVFLRRRRA